jgi:AraC-like DNA-binding protein
MNRTANLDSFLLHPVDSFHVGDRWFVFASAAGVHGVVVDGDIVASDAPALWKAWVGAAPHQARWLDLRRLTTADRTTIALFARILGSLASPQTDHRARTAILCLHADEVLGSVTVAPVSNRFGLFEDEEPAMGWLGIGLRSAFRRDLDQLETRRSHRDQILGELRGWLAKNLRDASLPRAAAALRTSRRSLQRRLSEHGTSFRNQLGCARVETAKRMLVDDDRRVQTIARTVGCGASHFGQSFRRLTGSAPGKWRVARSRERTHAPADEDPCDLDPGREGYRWIGTGTV